MASTTLTPMLIDPAARPAPDSLDAPKGLWINGEEVAGGQTFTTIDPTTEAVLAEVATAGPRDIDDAVAAARSAFEDPSWAAITPEERTRMLLQIADVVEANADELATLDSLEMGAPRWLTDYMVDHTVKVFRNFAGWPTKLYGDTATSAPSQFQYTRRQPLGVVVAISGWNGPLLQMGYKIAPALATGNTVVAKPSEQTSLSVLRLTELLKQTEVPPGVINVVTGDGRVVGETLMTHDGVDKVSFTGSTVTGKHILEASTSNLKHVTLELGGKSPYVIFADADLEAAARGAALGFAAGSGQACVAGSRIFVQESVREEFTRLLIREVEPYAHGLGDPFAPDTRMGPMAFRGHYEKVRGYVDSADQLGARLLTGAEPIAGDGLFVAPTLIDGIDNDSSLAQEEIFGPVAALMPFTDLDDVVQKGNDTIYGLAASVWTRDLATAHLAADRLDAGTVWVNRASQQSAGPLPFGGFKQSGLGREHGTQVLDAYTQVKSVVVQLG